MLQKNYRVIIAVIGTLLGLFMLWYFFNILVYIIIAGVISLIGQPIVEILSKLRIRKFRMPTWINALVALLLLIFVFIGLIMIFIPLISRQATVISGIDIDSVVSYFGDSFRDLQDVLIRNRLMEPDQNINNLIEAQVRSVMNMTNFSFVFNNLLSTTGTVFIGVFSVLFLSFFFLRDRHLLRYAIMLITPDKFQNQIQTILHKTKVLLSRYFIGLVSELLIMMTLITIGLALFGVQNALLIGFLGGLMNVIPYLGPVIGATIGALLSISSTLGTGNYDQVFDVTVTVILIFIICNVIDNMVLQPLIYSKSVHAHPIEIFLIILMAGSLAGIPGMILAIPGYTVLRIVAKEFLSGFKLVDKITEKI